VLSLNVIEINNLTKSYGKSRGIVGLNMNVAAGEIFGFIGPNGAGKSTTLRILLGFLQPTSGTARIFGMDSSTQTQEIKKHVGYLPAEVNYYDDMRVKDLLHYSAKFYQGNYDRRIAELSEYFDLKLNQKIDTLSFGNKKKVGIVQALLHKPQLLIMDEPTSGLDPLMQNRLFDLLMEENRLGMTVLFSSHVLSEVQRMCDRVAILKEGRIIQTQPVEALRSTQYKQVRIEFAEHQSLPSQWPDGVTKLTATEKGVEFLYSGTIDALILLLSSYSVSNLWIVEPALEEVFLHYYGRGEN
jgi:ABC-2 type transport system ATP-binding protein